MPGRKKAGRGPPAVANKYVNNEDDDGDEATNAEEGDDDEDEGHGTGTVGSTPSSRSASQCSSQATPSSSQDSTVFATPKPAKRNYPANRKPRSVPHIAPNANDSGFVKTSEQRETVVSNVLNVEVAAKRKADALKEKRVSYL